MNEKKIYFSIETALEDVPRDKWPTSPIVSRALLDCVRLRGIVRRHIMKRGVDLACIDDITSEVAIVLQMKMLAKLESPKVVYYVAFRVSQLVVSNYGKKSINTSFSDEISLSNFLKPGDDEQDALERLSSESAVDNLSDQINQKIDLDNARRRLTEKLAKFGWPETIQRERTRLGRPPKLQAVAV
jgi:hypothetical protein